ncbi:MAG: hypothetical protein LRY54_03085 [Alphaproteobacteria bacterium]|nr:hypothetical protein [Alphaproteobacteria bacterium]
MSKPCQRGGSVKLQGGDNGAVIFEATGENAELKPDLLKALQEDIPSDALTPRQMHAYTTRLLLKNYSYTLAIEQNQAPSLRLKLSCPTV